MMRALIVLGLALLPTMAGAWCSVPPPANPASGPPVQVVFNPTDCWPSAAGISGSGRGYLQKDFAPVPGATAMGGSAWGWWCQKPDLTWQPQTFACLSKYCPGTAILAVRTALAASSPGAAVQALVDSYTVKLTDWSETHDYNCLHSNMVAALQATKPAAGVWVVDIGTDATKTTRPAYPFTNGSRGTTSTARASSGQPCRPEVAQSPSSTTGTVYAAFGPDYSAALVALCRKQ